MGLYAQTVRGLRRAPYRDQVLVHLIRAGESERLSGGEEAKVLRVKHFLSSQQCADEIVAERRREARKYREDLT
jgi:hypothetical protein